MSLSREEQLEIVVRNIGDRSYLFEECIGRADRVFFSGEGVVGSFTRSEVEAKLREITGEPSDSLAPEWANWKGQCANGIWEWYRDKASPNTEKGFFEAGNGVSAVIDGEYSKGEIIGDWRDTLKKINRDKKEVSEVEKVDFPEAGVECLFKHPDFGWVGCTTIGVFREKMVCAPDGGGFYEGSAEDFKPAPSERDEFVSSIERMSKEGHYFPCYDTALFIYDAIKEGRLKAPEVKSD